MRATAVELRARLAELVEEQDRAPLVWVTLPPGLALGPEDLPAGAELVRVSADPAALERLQQLNTGRDLRLRQLRPLVLVTGSGEDARLLRRVAPDLTAVVDLLVELDQPTAAALGWLAPRVRQAQAQRLASVDLTGLLPGDLTPLNLSLRHIYQARELRLTAEEGAPRVVLLLGEPGSGKSTWLRHQALTAAGEELVLFAPLAAWAAQARDHQVGLLPFLERWIGALIDEPGLRLGPELGRLTLLLDGLDEVPSRGDRRRLVDEVLALSRSAPGVSVVLAGRDAAVDDLLSDQRAHLRLAHLAPLPPPAGQALVEGVLRARRGLGPADPLPPEVQERAQRVLGHPDLPGWSRNPLLLTLMASLADAGRGLPEQRALLYHELVEVLVVAWQRSRGGRAEGPRLSRADVLRLVGPLAWAVVERGGGGLTEEELLGLLGPRPAALERWRRLREDSALICARAGLWGFHHSSIAEFLAARAALLSSEATRRLAEDPYLPWRGPVVAFALALAADIEARDEVVEVLGQALEQRARRPGRYTAALPRTLAGVLVEARGLSPSWRDRLLRQLLRITLTQRLYPGDRVNALRALFRATAAVNARPAWETLAPEAVDWLPIASAWADHRRRWWHDQDGAPPSLLHGLGLPPRAAEGLAAQWAASPDPALRGLAWDAWAASRRERLLQVAAWDPAVAARVAWLAPAALAGPLGRVAGELPWEAPFPGGGPPLP